MSTRPKNSEQYAPNIEKTYALPVGGSTNLHTSVASGGAAPPKVEYLPSSLMIIVSTGGTFLWTDSKGNANTVTLPVGVFVPPFVPATLEIGTAIGTATAAWVA